MIGLEYSNFHSHQSRGALAAEITAFLSFYLHTAKFLYRAHEKSPHAIAHSPSPSSTVSYPSQFPVLYSNNASHVHHPCTSTHPPDTCAHPLLPRKSHRPLRATPERRLAPQKRHRRRHRPVLPLPLVSLRLVSS